VSLLYTYDGGGYDLKEVQGERVVYEKPVPAVNYLIALVITLFMVFVFYVFVQNESK